jgi:hypothetical protein
LDDYLNDRIGIIFAGIFARQEALYVRQHLVDVTTHRASNALALLPFHEKVCNFAINLLIPSFHAGSGARSISASSWVTVR